MTKIIETCKGSNSHVRKVKIRVGDRNFNNEKLPKKLVRPIHKIQLLVENHMVRFPDGEAVASNDLNDTSS